MNNFDYKNMTPFKWFVLENFPFIENDFEAINNYRLFSKVVEYLNKTIDNVNVLGNLVEQFSDYFDNLDVQDEINNKLDEMAEDGTLENIINQEIFGNINNQINEIQQNGVVAIGDSYGIRNTGWNYFLPTALGLINNVSYFGNCEGASGFTVTGHSGNKFIDLLNNVSNNIENKNYIKKVIVLSGYNDRNANYQDLWDSVIAFKNRAKELFPNATMYYGFIGCNSEITQGGSEIRQQLYKTCLNFKNICYSNNIPYLRNSELTLKGYDALMSEDFYHPNAKGCEKIAQMVVQTLNGQSGIFPNSKSLVVWKDTKNIASDITANVAYEAIYDNMYYIQGLSRILYNANQTLNTNTPLYIGSIQKQEYFRPNNENYLFRVPATAILGLADNTSKTRPGYIYCDNIGDWYFFSRTALTGDASELTNINSCIITINGCVPAIVC